MRTLKKTLALVLVVAMMMSVVVTANAAYDDADEITYVEAVEVMGAIGVVNGMGDGTFAPTAPLTRGQAAAIITRLVGAEAYAVSASDFADCAGHWADKYVAYCAANGYVDGYGDGNFGPDDALTGYAWAKMLLAAIGADTSAMTGSAWQIAVAKAASDYGIFTGNEKADKTVAATREEACLYALNAALYSETAAYYVVNGVTFTTAYDAYVFAALTESEVTVVPTTDNLLYDVHGVTCYPNADDQYGRPATVYTNAKDETIVEIVDEAVLTVSNALTEKTLQAALGKKATADVELPVGGNGTVTYVYATATADAYEVVCVPTYVYELTKTDIVEANAKKNVKAGILVDGKKYNTEDEYAEGDVVLYTLNTDDEVASVELAESFVGTVTNTSTSAKYVRFDNGDPMYLAANNDGLTIGDGLLVAHKDNVDVQVYVDAYGYIVAVKTIDADAPEISKDYVYVIGTQAKGAKSATNDGLFGTVAEGSEAAALAQILNLETGKVEVVNQALVENKDGDTCYATAAGVAGDEVVTTDYTAVGAIYEYTLIDGEYVLIGAADMKEVTLKKGEADTGAGFANSKTVVKKVLWSVDKNGNITGAEISTVTGIANFAKEEETKNAVVTAKNGIISNILIVEAKVEAPVVEPNIYAVYLGEGESTFDGQAYAFSIGGEVVNYYGTAPAADLVGKVVTIELTNGKLTATAAATAAFSGEVTYIDDTFMVVGGNVVYFAEAYTTVDAALDYDLAEVALKDTVTVYANSDKAAEYIVIEVPVEE